MRSVLDDCTHDPQCAAIFAHHATCPAAPNMVWQVALMQEVERVLLNEGGAPGSSLHSWRCEYPDRYGPCNCVRATAFEVVAALLPLIDSSKP